jgi:hypothetical protein
MFLLSDIVCDVKPNHNQGMYLSIFIICLREGGTGVKSLPNSEERKMFPQEFEPLFVF